MRSRRLLSVLAAAAGIIAITPHSASAQASRQDLIPVLSAASDPNQFQQAAAPVQEALNQFDSGLATHDIGLLQAAGIKPSHARGWQKFFKDNPDASVTDDCPSSSLMIAGDTANWYCTETATIISERKPVTFTKVIRFTFTRTSGGWTISDRR
jgi:hypothetical protein